MKVLSPHLFRGLGYRFWSVVFTFMGISFSTFINPILHTLRQGEVFFQGYHNKLINQAFYSNTIATFLPILAALPLSAAYIEDIKSKYIRFLIIREGYIYYIVSQCIACWLLSGMAVILGAVGSWGMATLVFYPIECVTVPEYYAGISTIIVDQLILIFLNGGLWAIMGLSMSTVMESKYIAYASPFILYYILIILSKRHFTDWVVLNPRSWLNPTLWPFGCWGTAIFLLEITLILAILFAFRAGRRLQQL